MRKTWILPSVVVSAVVLAAFAWSRPPEKAGAVQDGIAQVAKIRKGTPEDTCKARNDCLQPLFREHVRQQGGKVTAEALQQFYALLKKHDLTSFEDFRTAEMTPLQYRKDPKTGAQVPVFGPLGSDVINSWLAALEVVPGKPVLEQPLYKLAAHVLCERLDFALIGVRDPSLSLELLPPMLRENAAEAYRHLNPTNQFDGGFDHALYYATVREAAKKLFRHDFPHLKITMADVVLPEAKGGFGIRSCLLCHNRDHTGVYQRLIGQGLYLRNRAAEQPAGSAKANEFKASSADFMKAAEIVRSTFPDKVDAQRARRSLNDLSNDDLARLRPGYVDFYQTLDRLSCLKCHGTDGKAPPEKDPRNYGVYVLDPSNYHQTANIKALLTVINLKELNKSTLLLKASARMNHQGSDEVKLNAAQTQELREALTRWVNTFNESAGPSPQK